MFHSLHMPWATSSMSEFVLPIRECAMLLLHVPLRGIDYLQGRDKVASRIVFSLAVNPDAISLCCVDESTMCESVLLCEDWVDELTILLFVFRFILQSRVLPHHEWQPRAADPLDGTGVSGAEDLHRQIRCLVRCVWYTYEEVASDGN